MSFQSANAAPNIRFHTFSTVAEIQNEVSKLPDGAAIFLDVDDTLITPISSHAGLIIDGMKREKAKYPNFEIILSTWRLQRKVRLVDNAWPLLFQKFKEKHTVLALTAMDTGKYGVIPSMETWRADELEKIGLTFDEDFLGDKDISNIFKSTSMGFKKGIFMTGPSKKSEVIEKALNLFKTRPTSIVFVDDRLSQVQDIENFCKARGYDATLIHFKGVIKNKPQKKVMALQKTYLLKSPPQWLEDDEAQKLL